MSRFLAAKCTSNGDVLSPPARAPSLEACAIRKDLAPASRQMPETAMGGEMVLLRMVDDAREGWRWMPFEEFLERINLASWKDGQELVGMVLPQGRQRMMH